MKLLKKINLIFLFIFIVCSCTYQNSVNRINYGDLSKDELIKKIYEVNKEYCDYERKARFKVIDDYLSEEFKGFIKNSCNDKFSMNILGPFNKRLLAIKVEDGKIYVDGRDNLDKSIKVLLDGKDVNKLVRIFRFPYMFPDNNFVFHKMAGFYLLSLNNTRIYVNDQLYIYMVEDGDSYIKYEFRGNAVNQIYYKDKDTYLKIEFI